MARYFAWGPDRIVAASAAVTSYPVTLAAWCRPDRIGINHSAIGIGISGASDQSSFCLRITSSDILQARALDAAGGVSSATSSATVSLNAWTHVGGVFVSNTSRLAYLNGTSSSNTATRTVDPSTFAYSTVGANPTSAGNFSSFFSGDIAEAAWWAAELTAAEMAALAAGYSPLFVRPQSLRAYVPLFGRAGSSGDEEDWVGGLTFTQTSSPTLADHPRIIYPRRIWVPGEGAPTTFIPSWARQISRVIGGGV